MLVVEQLLSPHSHSHTSNTLPVHNGRPAAAAPTEVQFDAGTELGELELEQGFGYIENNSTPGRGPVPDEDPKRKAYPLTLGLVVHGLADGLALGVSALSTSHLGALSDLSLVVFLALIVHKGPTALALTTSLLATSLPRAECKRHIIFFSASTPLGAIVSYTVFSVLGAGKGGNWTGVALLVSVSNIYQFVIFSAAYTNHRAELSSMWPLSCSLSATTRTLSLPKTIRRT